MKIVSWNINGYRAITGQNKSQRLDVVTFANKLFDYIEKENPDVIGLQETKAMIDQIAEHLQYPLGYEGYYNSCQIKKGYSGTAVFTKTIPKNVTFGIGIDKFDCEGRIIESDFGDFVYFNIYFPKSYVDDPRMDYKLEFYDAVLERAKELMRQGRKVIISGDYNTARTEIDLFNPKGNLKSPGFLKVERDKMEEFFDAGFVDVYRHFVPEGDNYTWWSNFGGARAKNRGWRIDYHLVTKDLVPFVKSVKQQPEVFGSDHCPVVIELEL